MSPLTDRKRYCTHCERPLAWEWVACPHCGKPTGSGLPQEHTSMHSYLPNRFVCPGCGEKATAEGYNRFCSRCKAFVHFKCMVKHTASSHRCPICGLPLGL